MLSVIAAIHNGIAYNKVFLYSLFKYTQKPFELIVVDNCSSDGSHELFAQAGARILRNNANYCYACSMNQGMKTATGELLCFANNDIWFGAAWDVPLHEALEHGEEWVVCPAGVEIAESVDAKKTLARRWKRIGLLIRILGPKERILRLSLRLMYGNWESFCRERSLRLKGTLVHGIQGNCVVARRELFDKIGPWDTRVRAADWHLYLTVAKRAEEKGDVRRPRIVPASYVHHFIRGTVRAPHFPFACGHGGTELSQVWTQEELERFGWKKN